MKKLFLLTALGLATLITSNAAQVDGLVSDSFSGYTYDSSDNLWKSATDLKLLETYFVANWGTDALEGTVNLTNQLITVTTPGIGYEQWMGQVKATANLTLSATESYDLSCIVKGPDSSKVTFKLAVNNNDIEGAGIVYVNQGQLSDSGEACFYASNFTPDACTSVMLILDFGGYPNSTFTISDLVIQKHQDDSNVPAPPTYDQPSDVPVPTQEAANVLSLFSGKYTSPTTMSIGWWNQSTQLETIDIDETPVFFLNKFDYQGWDLNPAIDVSGYDYLHVDYWTPNGTTLTFTPINTNSTVGEKLWTVPEVKASTWNSYDAPLSYFSEAGVNLSGVNQFKLADAGGGQVYGYIANIYFYKSSGSETDTPTTPNPEPGTGTDKDGTITGVFTNAKTTADAAAADVNYTAKWSGAWDSETGKVTLTLTVDPVVVGLSPQLFVDAAYQGNFVKGTNDWTYTTTTTYKAGDKPAFALYFAYDGGATNQISISYTVVASSDNDEPTTPPTTDDGNKGENEDDENNLWADATLTLTKTYFATNDWTEITAPTVSLANNNISLTTPANMGLQQWQGQVFVGTDIPVDATKYYDFSMTLATSKDAIVTVKPTVNGGDNEYFVAVQHPFKAPSSAYSFTGIQGPANGKLVLILDFGGNPNQQFTITDIVFKEGSKGSSAIETIGNPELDANAPIEYYNLQGVRVANPTHGIYIIHQGNTSRKVVL